jgi:hypothetical protein
VDPEGIHPGAGVGVVAVDERSVDIQNRARHRIDYSNGPAKSLE